MRILLIEDDESLADGIATALRHTGYAVDLAARGGEGVSLARAAQPDVIVLDLGLPDIDGIEVLRQLRSYGVKSSVLILTARDDLASKVQGLDAGADDYLTKPFAVDELLARLRALERRAGVGLSAEIAIGDVQINLASHEVFRAGEAVRLSRREFTLLRALAERPGHILSREQLEDKLYSWGEEVSSNTVDVHIHNLRKKIYPEFIQTIRGVGYKVGPA
ncbi:response regulator transcription factor [Microbulbifer hydrolyticus]|uniref:Response regulator n=1 Tax=Microbulbifer hydrolyticus TaxID=48074 RepID=A0A6P1TF09_9GAMM|nr:response regulator transcription factor [Microbulbifer hydrolyticus]MBB5212644.1 two-component system OmpR family response regulator/two-component system response regulator QseB [Microbulbifer hydrolyticus]QHQ40246.1 response regulator [Microbulbifer hydrolyticus]